MTFEEQVGRVIIAVWRGESEEIAAQVALGRAGGLYIPAEAAPAEGELTATLNRLQRLATHPLLCLADAEGGLGPFVPGGLALAAARRIDLARRAGAQAAAEARARGIQLVLAPPFDVPRGASPLPGPCLGDNPSLVAHLGAAFVEGCQAAGAFAVGRYFPGRGGAAYDAQKHLAVLSPNRLALEKIDLAPYAEACRAGLGAIMTGHLHVPALDTLANRLATHSSAVVEGLLRGSLQFQGPVLSSDLDAPEVNARYGPAEAAVLAFAAGHDLLVTGHPAEVYRALYEVLLHGDIPPARLHEAVARVEAARQRLAEGPCAGEEALAAGPELAREVARASLVAIRGRPHLVARRRPLVIAQRLAPASGETLRRLAASRLPGAGVHLLDAEPAPAQLETVMPATASAGAALLVVERSPGGWEGDALSEATIDLAQALKQRGLPLGVALIGDPSALPRFAASDLLLYLPGSAAPHLEALFAYLGGEFEPTGRLPIFVPGL